MPEAQRGLLDTNILVLWEWMEPTVLPDEVAISTITLAELSAGVHLVTGADQDADDERRRRSAVLHRAEADFDPLPFDAPAARAFGSICAVVLGAGRSPRRRVADLMIASIASTNGLPLFTTNPDDFHGLDGVVEVVTVPRPLEAP